MDPLTLAIIGSILSFNVALAIEGIRCARRLHVQVVELRERIQHIQTRLERIEFR